MIDLDLLEEADKGRWVVYNNGRGANEGRIKSWNDKFVFVVYSCNGFWHRYEDYTAEATIPEDLAFSGGRIKQGASHGK